MVNAARADLSSTTPLFGICPTIEMGNGCHREETLTLVVFILSKTAMDWKRVGGRVLEGPMDSMASGTRVPWSCKVKIW